MKKNEYETLKKYMFCKMAECNLNDQKFNTNGKTFLEFINSYFETNISQSVFDEVTNGEGGEDKKITTFYSSSLQSLLFFSKVTNGETITINGTTYNKVFFEFENKVIGYPSSVDVVLVNETNGIAKDILFIESKLLEPVRDATLKNATKNAVVGKAYYINKNSGYEAKLNVAKNELEALGFELPTQDKEKYSIKPINENMYVYAYGIKQMLSHLIGIVNFTLEENSRIKTDKSTKISFTTLYNSLPNIGNNKVENARKKLDDFASHYNAVAKVLDNKLNNIEVLPIMTYQELYKQICDNYILPKPIVEFYHLNENDCCNDEITLPKTGQGKSGYTRSYIIKMCDDAIKNPANFYQMKAINYRGKTVDTDEYYTEVIAEYVYKNIDKFYSGIATISRETYKVEGHNGEYDENSNRNEEKIAMQMFNQTRYGYVLDFLGKIIDYQIPLKKDSKNTGVGKIDLISFNDKEMRVLELKDEDSKETMLRCVLEGYTYLRIIDHKILFDDFWDYCVDEKSLKASPLVYNGGYQQEEMKEDRPWLNKLMILLDIKPFYYEKKDDKFIITE